MNRKWVKVYSDTDYFKVELASHLLRANGLESHIMDKQDSAYVVVGDIHLFALQDQALKATNLLRKNDFF